MRPIEARDLPFITEHRNDFSTWMNLSHATPVWPHRQESWLDSLGDDQMYFIANMLNGGNRIGFLRLTDIDWQNSTALVGLDIFNEFRGKGHAKAVFNMLLKYIFDNLGLRKLTLYVNASNEAAINVYASAGFREEGTLIHHLYRNGVYYDYIIMSLFRKDYYDNPAVPGVHGGRD